MIFRRRRGICGASLSFNAYLHQVEASDLSDVKTFFDNTEQLWINDSWTDEEVEHEIRADNRDLARFELVLLEDDRIELANQPCQGGREAKYGLLDSLEERIGEDRKFPAMIRLSF